MPDQVWNFLIPGAGAHEFRWTGNTGYVDSRMVKMSSDKTHPDLAITVLGVSLLLKRKEHASYADPNKWVLQIDGRLVEETVLSSTGTRDLKNMQEGSYQIATHFSPSINPAAIYHFLVRGVSHSVSIGHDQTTGRVEIAVDNKVSLGRSYKILDSGLKLNLAVDGVDCQAIVSQNVFSWAYRFVANGKDVKPSYTAKGGGSSAGSGSDPVEVTGGDGGDDSPTKARSIGGGRRRADSGNASEDYGDTEKTMSSSYESGRGTDGDLRGVKWRGGDSFEERVAKSKAGIAVESKAADDDNRAERRPSATQADPSSFESETKAGPSSQKTWSYGTAFGDQQAENNTCPPDYTQRRPPSEAKLSPTATAYDEYEPVLPRGVTRDDATGGYIAGIMVGGKYLSLGTFRDVEDAAEAYREGCARYRKK